MENFNRFIDVVKKYAEAYKDFEEIQKDPDFDFIPEIGDQKTGVIGEAFIFEYLKRQGHSDLEFGGHSQKGWDIRYPFGLAPNEVVLVQVKTVSAFAKKKAISHIHLAPDYCELYLVSLNENLIPDNIWKPKGFNPDKIKSFDGEKKVTGTRMPKDKNDTASGFTGLENIFEDFKKAFPELY
ncbi:MAG: hypothetical protein LBI03_00655 [Clostridiales bacterium]|jgi:hypothetical protein|nr:hypothetical protein [Clostridiales bacterium]